MGGPCTGPPVYGGRRACGIKVLSLQFVTPPKPAPSVVVLEFEMSHEIKRT